VNSTRAIPTHLSETTLSILDRVKPFFHENFPHGIMYLFGSRVRGDERTRSDFDIGVQGLNSEEWLRWLDLWDRNDLTLYDFDWIRIEEADKSLKEKIEKEGLRI
jgi:predicted nucleotidyltransferase